MELAKQVTSLEISKKLKELGFQKDSLYYISYCPGNKQWIIDTDNDNILETYRVYTASELMEYICFDSEVCLHIGREEFPDKKQRWSVYFTGSDGTPITMQFDFSLPDSLGKLLIYLLSNNLIDGNHK